MVRHFPDRENSPTNLQHVYKNAFPYETQSVKIVPEELPYEETDTYKVFHLLFPTKKPIEARYFKSKLAQVKKLVIILPIYGKYELPAEWFLYHLTLFNTRADFDAIYIQERKGDDPFDLDTLSEIRTEEDLVRASKASVEKFKNLIEDVRHVLDWVERENPIYEGHIGVAGFSLSSFVASVLVGVDSRISVGAILFGGANFHEMFGYAKERRLQKIRERVLRASRKNLNEFISLCKILFQEIDPINYTRPIDSSRIIYVDSDRDEFVPSRAREAFWRSAGMPERITFLHSHKISFLSMTPVGFFYTQRKVIDFLRKKL